MKALGNIDSILNTTPANKVQSHLTIVQPKWKLSFWLSAPSQLALGCDCVPVCLLTVAVAAGGQVLLPHVEHHTHRTVVSGGAGESLSSAPTGLKPGAKNWDLTVRAMTSCFAHLLLILVLIDSTFYDNITLSLCVSTIRAENHPAFGQTPVGILFELCYLHSLLILRGLNLTMLP